MSEWGQFVHFNTPPMGLNETNDIAWAEVFPEDSHFSNCVKTMEWTQLAKIMRDQSVIQHITLNIPVVDTIPQPIRRRDPHHEGLDCVAQNFESNSAFNEIQLKTKQKGFSQLNKQMEHSNRSWGGLDSSNEEPFHDLMGKIVKKKGILVKRGFHWRKAWVERLVVLNESRLEYYEADNDHKPVRGFLKLNPDAVCRPSNCDWRNYCFEVVSGKDEIWYLQAPSKHAYLAWISAVKAVIEKLQQPSTIRLLPDASISKPTEMEVASTTVDDDEPVDIFSTNRFNNDRSKTNCNRSPPVTPPMQIYYGRKSSGALNDSDQQRVVLPRSPRVQLCGEKVVNLTWPAPNYKFADTDKVNSRKDHPVYI